MISSAFYRFPFLSRPYSTVNRTAEIWYLTSTSCLLCVLHFILYFVKHCYYYMRFCFLSKFFHPFIYPFVKFTIDWERKKLHFSLYYLPIFCFPTSLIYLSHKKSCQESKSLLNNFVLLLTWIRRTVVVERILLKCKFFIVACDARFASTNDFKNQPSMHLQNLLEGEGNVLFGC
jgi:hypothetical protein